MIFDSFYIYLINLWQRKTNIKYTFFKLGCGDTLNNDTVFIHVRHFLPSLLNSIFGINLK